MIAKALLTAAKRNPQKLADMTAERLCEAVDRGDPLIVMCDKAEDLSSHGNAQVLFDGGDLRVWAIKADHQVIAALLNNPAVESIADDDATDIQIARCEQ